MEKKSFTFSSFREKVLNRAINELSKLEFELKLITYREGRKITGVSFKIIKKPFFKNQEKTQVKKLSPTIIDVEPAVEQVQVEQRKLTEQEKQAIEYIINNQEGVKHKGSYFSVLKNKLIAGDESTVLNVAKAIEDKAKKEEAKSIQIFLDNLVYKRARTLEDETPTVLKFVEWFGGWKRFEETDPFYWKSSIDQFLNSID